MALDSFVAGAYTTTYNAVDVGVTEDGYELQQDTNGELINQTDQYGDSIIDFVHRGGSVYIMYTGKAFKAGIITPYYPWGALGALRTAAAPIGRLASAVAAALVMTATANTAFNTAGATVVTTLTASLAILAPGSNLKLLFTSKVRNVPVRQLLLPSGSATVTWYVVA